MYKAIIVDDEQRIRQGLKIIVDWHACGFEVVDDAEDGSEALVKIQEQQPDLILLDIKMPVYDGITLLRILRDQGYKGKVIFLTGFAELEFAKKAIALGADAYLTKPIDEVELYQFLTDIKQKLDEATSIHKKLESHKTLEEKHLFRRLIYGQSIPPIDYMLEADKYIVAEVQFETYLETAFNFFDDYQKRKPQTVCFAIDQNWILIFKNFSMSRMKVALNDLIAELKHHVKGEFFVSVGREVTGYTHLYESFQDAKLLGQQFFLDHEGHLVFYDTQKCQSGDHFYIDNDLLFHYIEVCNQTGIDDFFRTAETSIRSRTLEFAKVKLLIANSYFEVNERVIQHYALELPNGNDKSHMTELLLNQKKLGTLLELYKTYVNETVKSIHDGSKTSNIKRLMDYIESNYEKDLKLERLAEIFSYNSSYLGTLIKQHTDMSFNTYLDAIRIQHAKQLLLSNEFKVYEVAQLVGYSSVDYFHSKFKKYVNMSPKQFQQLKGVSQDEQDE